MGQAGFAGICHIDENADEMTVAVAIFAKTAGLSPVKTRLAADIGSVQAEAFYRLSVAATKEWAAAAGELSNGTLCPYWAVAEQEAVIDGEWDRFDTIWTGDGGLGARLDHVYRTLMADHDAVMLMGTDSPQLEPQILIKALREMERDPAVCVIGPCADGGFYMFAGKTVIERDIWTSITYSADTTRQQLLDRLDRHAIPVRLLDQAFDVDTAKDLALLGVTLDGADDLSPAKRKLADWLRARNANKRTGAS